MIDGALPLAAVIAAVAALAFWLDHRVPVLSKLGASLLTLIFGALLSNLGLVPVQQNGHRVIRCDVPDAQRSFDVGRDQARSVAVERQGGHFFVVAQHARIPLAASRHGSVMPSG